MNGTAASVAAITVHSDKTTTALMTTTLGILYCANAFRDF